MEYSPLDCSQPIAKQLCCVEGFTPVSRLVIQQVKRLPVTKSQVVAPQVLILSVEIIKLLNFAPGKPIIAENFNL